MTSLIHCTILDSHFDQRMGNNFTAIDSLFVIIITTISMWARLWTIAQPASVIFDEVHFGNFSKWYVLNQFHFDIHPPLGKMLMGYIAKATQYKGDITSFPNLGTPYKSTETSYISQRMTPAIFSSMVPPLLYCSMRLLGISHFPSFAGAIMIALDSSMIVEAKFILSDGMLHFFSALHFYAFCLFLKEQTELTTILAGITLGAAASCKFTALGLIAVDGVSQLFWIYFKRPDFVDIFLRAAFILVPAVLTFFGVWVVHFACLKYTGYHSYYIRKADAHTLIDPEKVNASYWGNRVKDSPLLFRIIDWLAVMNRINMRSNIPHPWSSSPEYWPTLTDKWVSFYTSSPYRKIPCFGLPSSYWISTGAIPLTILGFVFKLADWRNLLLLWGWAVSYFPFLLIPRTMFHYHYLVPLMFATMNTGALIDCALKRKLGARGALSMLVIALTIACYFYFFPFIYGTSCENCMETRLWVRRWVDGPPKPLNYYGANIYNTTKRIQTLPL